MCRVEVPHFLGEQLEGLFLRRRLRGGCRRGDRGGLGGGVRALWRFDRMDLDILAFHSCPPQRDYLQ